MDTSPEAERVHIAMIRKLPLTRRFSVVRSLSSSTLYTNRQYIQELHSDISKEEQSLLFVTDVYGQTLANGLRTVLEKRTTQISDTPDILAAMKSVIDVFAQLGVAYYISGSVASSVYGIAQAAQDIDIVANLQPEHVQPLVAQLQTGYYIDEGTVRKAIQQHTWFNAIHLESILKIDIFLPKDRPFDQQMFSRARQHVLEKNYPPFSMISPEDSILTQLEWHRKDDKVADDRWNAILGVLKIRGPTLDLAYLKQWATALQIDNLLEQALIDAGLEA